MSRDANEGFAIFRNRVLIRGRLTTATGLHIGAGTIPAATGTDKVVVRNRYGHPFLPGSSLKGVVRAAAASVLRGFPRSAPNGGRCHHWACSDDLDKDERCFDRPKKEKNDGDPTPEEVEKAAFRLTCPLCRVFGSPFLAAKVRFADAPLLDDESWLGPEVRDGVGIDRDTRTAARAIKYDFEVVPPGTEFALDITLDNSEGWENGMVLLGFDLLHQGLARLGGIKSRGLGRVAIEWSRVRRWDAAAALRGEAAEDITGTGVETWVDQQRESLEKAVRSEDKGE